MRNSNARDLGLNDKDFKSEAKINQFLQDTMSDFKYMIITEYTDESLVLLRRKLCWEISDIMYLPLRILNYSYKETKVNVTLIEKLKSWSKVDFLLYKLYNQTLWNRVYEYGEDFRKELKFYRFQKKRVIKFCKPVALKPWEIERFLDVKKSIMIPKSPWGAEFNIDPVWCLLSKLNLLMFRNIIKIKEYPEICESNQIKLKLKLKPAYCSENKTFGNNTFQIALPILINGIYNL